MTAILGGIWRIASGKDVQGLVAIISTFTALAATFIYGRYKQAQEREQKRREALDAGEQRRLPYENA